MHDKKPDLSYLYVFCSLCYSTSDTEDLGKLKPKADNGIFLAYAPAKKAFRIYNRRTRLIMETIHVTFDELTAMTSKQSSLGPALHEMTRGTISSGLFFNPPPSVVSLVCVVATPRPADLTVSPSSTSIDKVAPSASTSSTIHETQSLIISKGVEEQIQPLQFVDDPFLDLPTPEPSSHELSSNVQSTIPPFELLGKWTKTHLLANKNFKEAKLKSSWIEAMHEEINEFKRLEVWELVPCLDFVTLIKLKWIFKVKKDEFRGVLKNKLDWLLKDTVKRRGLISRNLLHQLLE
ncbi:retrovirus-related pol polyprotein from transposon TNT 1-94 [Tanacetum coccineum]|uniref:Retrovirus-related pol polyprotein from transposon TNT 1-94 n=1 Tax=Tanacetum coccineum TaxID=301880 RepID=A0ABQ4YHI6_9ASTR